MSYSAGFILEGLGVVAGLAFGAVYLSGKLLLLAAKGAVKAGKAIYAAHKAAEEERLAKAREELSYVQGELGKIALEQQKKIAQTEKELSAAYEKAVNEREAKIEEAEKRLSGTEKRLEDIVLELPSYFTERQNAISRQVDSEMAGFAVSLDHVCKAMTSEVTLSLKNKQQETMQKLDAGAASLEERKAQYLNLAIASRASCESLLTALQNSYDCGTFAPVEYKTVTELLRQLNELLESDNSNAPRMAAVIAGELESSVLILQIRLEQRTAAFNHQKTVLMEQAGELKAMAEATHEIEDPEGVLNAYVTDEYDVDFWSDDILSGYWKEADRLMKKVEEYSFGCGIDPAILSAEIEKNRLDMEREHARVRSRLLSRCSLMKMALDLVSSMKEDGWKCVGKAVHNDDPRQAIELKFRNGSRDEWKITVYDEYDEERGIYVQKCTRYANESGMVDEGKRADDLGILNNAMQKRGYNGFNIGCDVKTKGIKKPLD